VVEQAGAASEVTGPTKARGVAGPMTASGPAAVSPGLRIRAPGVPTGHSCQAVSGSLSPEAIAAAAGWPNDPERALAAAQSLVDDGLAVAGPDGSFRLP
jgi:hypothetical protein